MSENPASSRNWRFLVRLVEMLSTADGMITSGAVAALADRVMGALTSQRAVDAKLGAAELQAAFRDALAKSPPETRRLITSPQASPAELKAAFSLGQLDFAGTLLGRAVERRADARFEEMLEDPRFRPLVRALAQGPASGVDLAARLSVAEETVSRKLQQLREVGIAEFRREGVQLINFLSPAATAMMGPHVPVAMRSEAAVALEGRKRSLAAPLQESPVFTTRIGVHRTTIRPAQALL